QRVLRRRRHPRRCEPTVAARRPPAPVALAVSDRGAGRVPVLGGDPTGRGGARHGRVPRGPLGPGRCRMRPSASWVRRAAALLSAVAGLAAAGGLVIGLPTSPARAQEQASFTASADARLASVVLRLEPTIGIDPLADGGHAVAQARLD